MTETQTEVQIDLRDEVQYLRELVESLLAELKNERQRQQQYFPPVVVLPAPPPKIIRREYYCGDLMPHTIWATNTVTNSLGTGSCNTILWQTNIEDDDTPSGVLA